MSKVLSVGGNGVINTDKILGMGEAKGNPILRLIQSKEADGLVMDFRKGKAAKTIIYLEGGFIALSTTTIETVQKRLLEL